MAPGELIVHILITTVLVGAVVLLVRRIEDRSPHAGSAARTLVMGSRRTFHWRLQLVMLLVVLFGLTIAAALLG